MNLKKAVVVLMVGVFLLAGCQAIPVCNEVHYRLTGAGGGQLNLSYDAPICRWAGDNTVCCVDRTNDIRGIQSCIYGVVRMEGICVSGE